MNRDNDPSRFDRSKLMAAEAALVALTNECGGDCEFRRGDACLCSDRVWPAIEAIRAEILARARGE